MAGTTKRAADYVPALVREELDTLSKADLMELVWLAATHDVESHWGRSVTPDGVEAKAYARVRRDYHQLAAAREQKPKHLLPRLADLAKRQLERITNHLAAGNVLPAYREATMTKRMADWDADPANAAYVDRLRLLISLDQ